MEKSSQGGFTLLELIVVLVIIGLLSLFVLPRLFNSLTNVQLRSAARTTKSILNQARDIAYFEKKKIKVSFDIDNGNISVLKYASENYSPIKKLNYSFPDKVKINEYQKKDEVVTNGSFEILFSTKGNSSGGNLILGNNRKKVYEIEVDLITGYARITR